MIITDLSDHLFESGIRTAVTVGKFDGLHLGHRELILAAAERKNEGLIPLVLLIDMNTESGRKSLLDPREEEETLSALGAEILIRVPFTKEFSEIAAENFAEDILCSKLHAGLIISGEDFCFGKDRRGNPAFLRSISSRLGFEYECLPRVFYKNAPISSTRIRDLLGRGEIGDANTCLGRRFEIKGPVIHGMHLASSLGFPTANILPDERKFLPRFGVYRVFSEIGGQSFTGLANLGVKPTVPGERKALLEVYFPGYTGDLYGRTLTVFFDEFLRPEHKFPDLLSLRAQIAEDLRSL